MNLATDDKELRLSIRLLGSVLAEVLNTQAKPAVAHAVDDLQKRFTGFRRDFSLQKRWQLLAIIENLDADSISEVVRVFNRYFSLLTIAEEAHYLRQRRQSQIAHYWPGSFHDTLLKLKESGVTANKLQTILDALLYLPVMTAHPLAKTVVKKH